MSTWKSLPYKDIVALTEKARKNAGGIVTTPDGETINLSDLIDHTFDKFWFVQEERSLEEYYGMCGQVQQLEDLDLSYRQVSRHIEEAEASPYKEAWVGFARYSAIALRAYRAELMDRAQIRQEKLRERAEDWG